MSNDLWEPLAVIPIGLQPYTGQFVPLESLFPETIIDPDELSEWNE